MQLDPRRLLVLRAVDRHGSVVAAAAALHLTASAVSQQLAVLEREVGVALIDRSRRGGQRSIALTAAGRMLAQHGERLGGVIDEAELEMSRLVGAVSGTVTVAAFFTSITGFVGAAMRSVAETYPAVTPHIVDIDEPDCIDRLRAGTVDLAIVEDDADHRRPPLAGLRYEPLVDDPFRIAVPAHWPVTPDLSDYAERAWVGGPPSSAVGQLLDRIRAHTGLPFPARHSCLEFSAALAIVGAGLAGAFVPELALAALVLPAEVRVLGPIGVGSRRLGVVYRHSRREPTPVVALALAAVRDVAIRSA